MLQQHLPFTVLKPEVTSNSWSRKFIVATALTVYGIETGILRKNCSTIVRVATALTVYGIETFPSGRPLSVYLTVATALTVYGIETRVIPITTYK